MFWPWPSPPASNPPVVQVQNPSNNTTSVPPTGQNGSGTSTEIPAEWKPIQETYKTVVEQDGNQDNIKLGRTAVTEEWALQDWVGDETGGEALLKYDAETKVWVVVDSGGGAWSVEGLVQLGVPEAVAVSLLSNLRQ